VAIPSFIMAIPSFVTVTRPAAMAASRADHVRAWSDGRTNFFFFAFIAGSFPLLAHPIGQVDHMGME
jgi:hypothetical protein